MTGAARNVEGIIRSGFALRIERGNFMDAISRGSIVRHVSREAREDAASAGGSMLSEIDLKDNEPHNIAFDRDVIHNSKHLFDEWDFSIINQHLSLAYFLFQLGWDAAVEFKEKMAVEKPKGFGYSINPYTKEEEEEFSGGQRC
jgi:hypothetical protein